MGDLILHADANCFYASDLKAVLRGCFFICAARRRTLARVGLHGAVGILPRPIPKPATGANARDTRNQI